MSQIVAVVSDLIFRSKIDSTARAVGVSAQVVSSSTELSAALQAGGIDKVLIDLGLPAGESLQAIRIARDHDADMTIVAFGSHVDKAALQAASDAGADQVMPRSQFTSQLQTILTDSDT